MGYIVISLPSGSGHILNKNIRALQSNDTFTTDLAYSKRFDKKDDAINHLNWLRQERKKDGFHGTFVIWELI